MNEKVTDVLATIKDRSLTKRVLKEKLEVDTDTDLIAKLSTMTEEESLAWQTKLKFGDFVLLRGALGGIAYRAEKAAQANGESGSLDGLGSAVGLGTVALAAEAGIRISELVGGSGQSYNANLSLGDLESAFEAALQGSDITVQRSMAEFILLNGEGKELLKVQVNNSDEEASRDETAYDEYGSRIVGRCSVRITKSDLLSLAGGAAGAGMEIINGLSGIDKDSDINDALSMLFMGLKSGKEVLDVVNLPNLLAVEVEKIAQKAEQLARQKTDSIRGRNRDRFDEVKKGLICTSCDVPRTSEETTCLNCGAALSARAESISSLEADKVKLAGVGLTF